MDLPWRAEDFTLFSLENQECENFYDEYSTYWILKQCPDEHIGNGIFKFTNRVRNACDITYQKYCSWAVYVVENFPEYCGELEYKDETWLTVCGILTVEKYRLKNHEAAIAPRN